MEIHMAAIRRFAALFILATLGSAFAQTAPASIEVATPVAATSSSPDMAAAKKAAAARYLQRETFTFVYVRKGAESWSQRMEFRSHPRVGKLDVINTRLSCERGELNTAFSLDDENNIVIAVTPSVSQGCVHFRFVFDPLSKKIERFNTIDGVTTKPGTTYTLDE
jgi:hypothetical protein